MLSHMADVKAGTIPVERTLDATARSARAAQERLDGLLAVARIAREARERRTRRDDKTRPNT